MQIFAIALAAVAALVTAQKTPTPDGSCGVSLSFSCTTPQFGRCCSRYGYCGDTIDYCGQGCQTEFSDTDACLTSVPSHDGACGIKDNVSVICAGAVHGGKCCSKYGSCGTGAPYCSIHGGCQAAYGAPCTSP